ncbi:hypothetical protein D9M70_485590 [compost metagenome]
MGKVAAVRFKPFFEVFEFGDLGVYGLLNNAFNVFLEGLKSLDSGGGNGRFGLVVARVFENLADIFSVYRFQG